MACKRKSARTNAKNGQCKKPVKKPPAPFKGTTMLAKRKPPKKKSTSRNA